MHRVGTNAHEATVISIEEVATPEYVYDVTVEGTHNFFVDGHLVRNCDESHMALGSLESMLAVYLDKQGLESLGAYFPQNGFNDWDGWRGWASNQVGKASREAQQLKNELKEIWDTGRSAPSSLLRAHRTAMSMERKLSELANSKGKWVQERRGHGWLLSPVWVTDYMPLVYRDTGKIAAMSAVLTPKLMTVLGMGIENGKADYIEMPSYFPPKNSPIIHIPTVRINHKSSKSDMAMWVARIDQIIDRRLDRKGIVFTTSYVRRDLLVKGSRHKGIMVSHSTKDVVAAVNRFKEMDPPAVLVSPAVTSGYDFPQQEDGNAQYLIIGKIPYPDTTVPAVKARMEIDPDWTSWMAMQTLVQSAGRASRSITDKAEIFICDDSWKWFWPKYKNMAPLWFANRIVRGSYNTVTEPAF